MTLRLDIASPKEVCFSENIEMAVMPGAEGDIATQPGHVPTMLSLRPGVISIEKNGRLEPSFFVTGGFADIGPEVTMILADDVTPVSELSMDDAKMRLDKVMEVMTNVVDLDSEHEDLQRQMKIAEAELEACKNALKK